MASCFWLPDYIPTVNGLAPDAPAVAESARLAWREDSLATPFRIATYNVENLFSRARVINLSDPSRGDEVLTEAN